LFLSPRFAGERFLYTLAFPNQSQASPESLVWANALGTKFWEGSIGLKETQALSKGLCVTMSPKDTESKALKRYKALRNNARLNRFSRCEPKIKHLLCDKISKIQIKVVFCRSKLRKCRLIVETLREMAHFGQNVT